MLFPSGWWATPDAPPPTVAPPGPEQKARHHSRALRTRHDWYASETAQFQAHGRLGKACALVLAAATGRASVQFQMRIFAEGGARPCLGAFRALVCVIFNLTRMGFTPTVAIERSYRSSPVGLFYSTLEGPTWSLNY